MEEGNDSNPFKKDERDEILDPADISEGNLVIEDEDGQWVITGADTGSDGEYDVEDFDEDMESAGTGSDADDEALRPAEIIDASPECSVVFRGHTDSVYAVSFAPVIEEGFASVISGGGDDLSLLWDHRTGNVIDPSLQGHDDSVVAVCFSADGSLCASGSMDGTVRVYCVRPAQLLKKDMRTGDLVSELTGPTDAIEFINFHPAQSVILAGDSSGLVWLWNAVSGVLLKCLSGHAGPVNVGCFVSEGRQICTGSDDGTVRIWRPNSDSPCLHVFRGHQGAVLSVCERQGSPVVLSGAEDGSVAMWHRESGQQLHFMREHDSSVESVLFGPKGDFAASSGMDGKLIVWNVVSGLVLHRFEHKDGISQMCWHPNGDLIYSGGVDTTICVWNIRTGERTNVFRGQTASVLSMDISPDGKFLASASDDSTVAIYVLQ